MGRFVAAIASVLLVASSGIAVGAENASRGLVTPEFSPGVGLGTGVFFAVVNADGTLARQSGVASVVKTGTGNYRVLFRRNVRNRVYTATIGRSGTSGTETNSSIDVVADATSTSGVFVDTEDFAGMQVDRGFHMIVFCDQ